MQIQIFPETEPDGLQPATTHLEAPCAETLKAAAEEVAAIRARHDGVHTIHGIYCAMMCYQQFAAAGRWNEVLQKGFDSQLIRARQIDRLGFDRTRPESFEE